MKLPRFLFPVVIFLAVLFLSYPVILKEITDVFIVNNDPVPVTGSVGASSLPAVQIEGTVNTGIAPRLGLGSLGQEG